MTRPSVLRMFMYMSAHPIAYHSEQFGSEHEKNYQKLPKRSLTTEVSIAVKGIRSEQRTEASHAVTTVQSLARTEGC